MERNYMVLASEGKKRPFYCVLTTACNEIFCTACRKLKDPSA